MCVFVGPQVCFVSISQFANDFWFLLFSPSQEAVSVWTDVLSRDETTAAAGRTPQGGPTCSPRGPRGKHRSGSGFVHPLSELGAETELWFRWERVKLVSSPDPAPPDQPRCSSERTLRELHSVCSPAERVPPTGPGPR